jgi:hypothetical protein
MIDQIMVLFAHARQKIADVSHHAACAMHVLVSGFGQPQLTGRSMKQRDADLIFELGDALCHDRGRDVQLAGGSREAGGIGGSQKGLEIDERIHLLFSIRES